MSVPAALPWSEEDQIAIRKATQSIMERSLKLNTSESYDEITFKKGIWQQVNSSLKLDQKILPLKRVQDLVRGLAKTFYDFHLANIGKHHKPT